MIEEKDSLGQVERQNNEKLRKELEEFLYHLDTISDNHIRVLRNAQLSDPTSINQCCLAARAMNQFLNKKSELCSMSAFQSRIDELNIVRDEFVDKFFSHITALFERMVRSFCIILFYLFIHFRDQWLKIKNGIV